METGAVIVWKKAQIVSPTIRQFISFIKENRVIQDGQEKDRDTESADVPAAFS